MTDLGHEVRPRNTVETENRLAPGAGLHIRVPLHAAQHVRDDGGTEIVEHGHEPAEHPNLLLREPAIIAARRKRLETTALPVGHR
ncbi:hypothetical protein ACIQ6K_26605 [Streptomyces sp. NPDC096354]|uniref:hypothetical protein n=1 Tax=Streptomyces sp. NPDC096354 TaxID=3366088 RepID=UPI00380589B8